MKFKIKFRDKTLIHGVMEIENIKEYKKKVNETREKARLWRITNVRKCIS